jgi:hypothetical protein
VIRPRIVARAVAFALIAFYTLGGPFYRQVLGGRNPVLRNWVMFSGANLDVCEVRFHRAGDSEAIDRYEVLGSEPWYMAGKSVRKLASLDDVWRQGRQLCHAMTAGTDLRADARCATRAGWKQVMTSEVDLCSSRPPKKGDRASGVEDLD